MAAIVWRISVLTLILTAFPGALMAAAQAALDASALDQIYERLYNFDFPNARTKSAAYIAIHASDPLGRATHAAVLPFEEMHRAGEHFFFR